MDGSYTTGGTAVHGERNRVLSYRVALPLSTVFLLLVAVFSTQHFASRWQTDGIALAPQLADQLETVGEIIWQDAQSSETDSVSWEGSHWVVAKPSGYPADRERVFALLESLVEMHLIEEKSRRPEDYGQLGLNDIHAPGSRSGLLRVIDDSGETLLEVLVGDRSTLRTGHFLRRPSSPQSWLGDREVALPPPESIGWLQSTIVDLPYSRVASLRIADELGGQWTLERDSVDEKNLRLVEQPEFMRLRYASALNRYGNLLQDLQLDGVEAAATQLTATQGQFDFNLYNGLMISATLYQDSVAPWLRLSFSSAEGASAEAVAEAEQMNARHSPWVYQLSHYVYDRFQFRLEDVLEPEPDEALEAEPH